MPDVKSFNPRDIIVSFGPLILTDFMEGTFVATARAEDAVTATTGAGGNVVRVFSNNRMGSVTVTLIQSSAANALLSAIAREDELFKTGFRAVQVEDLNGTTLAFSAFSWIRKIPDSEFADSVQGREWVFDCHELEYVVGGHLV